MNREGQLDSKASHSMLKVVIVCQSISQQDLLPISTVKHRRIHDIFDRTQRLPIFDDYHGNQFVNCESARLNR